MSKMAELSREIEEMVNLGYSSIKIAETLHVPLTWVRVVEDNMNVCDYNVTEEEQYYDERP
jgi:hypothetical protein